MLEKRQKRYRRHKRIRAKISGTGKLPRLCVFKSTKHIYAQLIDDQKGRTLVAASDLEAKKKTKGTPTHLSPPPKRAPKIKATQKSLSRKVLIAYEVGKIIAEKAIKKKIKKVMFDRGGYKYHGRIKALADGAREGGLKF